MKFIESICFKNRRYLNLSLHQERVNRTCLHFFQKSIHVLTDVLPDIQNAGSYKVRLVYDAESFQIDYMEYEKKEISTIELIDSKPFDYSFKYENRSTINFLAQSSRADEIIISIDGLITDSSYSNLAFWNGDEWLTPEKPLLAGIRRSKLLETGEIKKAPIRVVDLGAFEKLSLINAMLDLGELEFPIAHILK